MKTYKRNCPVCNKSIIHRNKAYRNFAAKRKRTCKSCRILGSKHPRFGKSPPPQVSKAIVESNKRRIWTKKDREKMSRAVRLAIQSRVHKNGNGPCYNPVACKIFDSINKELSWRGVYATNRGEYRISGYWVDYYEPDKNIVIEHYEFSHKKPSRMKRDLIRQKRIVKEIGCQFYIIWENEDWKDVLRDFV